VRNQPTGSLNVVGAGIRFSAQTTPEARHAIETADVVVHLGGEPIGDDWLGSLNADSRSLAPIYATGVERGDARSQIYEEMADSILDLVRAGKDVCVALYGHPMVFATPARLAVEQAEAEGYAVRVLPGISAVDCLLADLRFDPGRTGIQSYEATRFLERNPHIEPTAALVLWQIGALGNDHAVIGPPNRGSVVQLIKRLLEIYPLDHEVVLYRASEYAAFEARIDRLPFRDLPDADIDPMATLFVPPAV
jgi:uncharacterized protein YabN with tetrapyrrole methylase and pyrophosphatase domain